MERLSKIQRALKAPKNQTNNFGKYRYRKAEDILEAVKPLLATDNLVLLLNDDVREVAGRYFLVATASLYDGAGKEIASSHAFAELSAHAGMSSEQATGAASSYARKYALNGLFAIDDSKDDPDGLEPAQPKKTEQPADEVWKKIQAAKSVEDINALMPVIKGKSRAHIEAFKQRVAELHLAYSDVDKEYVEAL